MLQFPSFSIRNLAPVFNPDEYFRELFFIIVIFSFSTFFNFFKDSSVELLSTITISSKHL